MEKRKIYLSGKITGDEGFAEKFKAKEEELSARGDYVFNPALHPDMFTHGQFMQIDLLALSFCDSIYLMDNWRDSKGAKMEFEQARVLGLPCEFEEKELCLLRHYEGGKDEIPTYYSNKKEEFVGLEDITADDFFDNKREAEEKVWSELDWDNGNVQTVSAEEVFGNQKDISFEQSIKNEKDISKVQNAIQTALEETAVPLKEIPLTRENWTNMFPFGKIETPIGTIKLGENQYHKLQKDDRNNLLLAMYDTLSNPSIVISKETFDEKSEEFKPMEVFGKSFIREESGHKRIIESVIIFRDGDRITIGTHNKDFKRFVNQIKTTEQLTYLDKTVGRVASLIIREGGSHVRLHDAIGNKDIPVKSLETPLNEMRLSSGSSISQKENESNSFKAGSKVSLDLKNLFNTFREENGYEPTTLIEFGKPYDYLSLSRGVQIRHSVDDGMDYYDLIDKENNILCCDGETCEVTSRKRGECMLQSEDSDIPFALSDKELEIATQKISLAKSPAASMILSNERQQSPSHGKSEKESSLEQRKQITAKEVLSYIENLKIRHPSKWLQAVKQDAEGLLNLFIEKHGDAAFSEKDLLRGSRDWSQYCYAGGALVSNYNIAKRYCSDDELKKLGWKENGYCPEYPNKKETWQDVQARAYFQASELIKRSVHDMEIKRENKIEQKSPTKLKSKDDDFGMGR